MSKFKNIIARTDITADPPLVVDPGVCDLCGGCISICPPDCIAMNDHALVVLGSTCIRCGFCISVCPVSALKWNENTRGDLRTGDVRGGG